MVYRLIVVTSRGGTGVKFINLDGAVLIGPGSEWFWTAISGIVLVATLVAIYHQLRLQRAATTFEQARNLAAEWESERMLRARLGVLSAASEGPGPVRVPISAAATVANYWEAVGALAKAGHVDLEHVEGLACRLFWARLNAFGFIQLGRERANDPEILANFEWLAEKFAERERRAGRAGHFDAAALSRLLPGSIENAQGALSTAEELRAVIVRPMSTGLLEPDNATTSE
jgi:hypothetical protein